MPELFQISGSHSGMGKKVGSMDLVRLSGGLLVKIKSVKFKCFPCCLLFSRPNLQRIGPREEKGKLERPHFFSYVPFLTLLKIYKFF
jgi:hypothetical protein